MEFCSPRCRADAERHYHALLCPALGGGGEAGVNPAALFEQQAHQTNEIFLLAGRLVATVLEIWARNGNRLDAAMQHISVLHAEVREGAALALAPVWGVPTPALLFIHQSLPPSFPLFFDRTG